MVEKKISTPGLASDSRYVMRLRTISGMGVKSDWSEALELNTPSVPADVWEFPSLLNGWAIYPGTGGYAPPRYMKFMSGLVLLSGLLDGTDATNDISFVLPEGYRPSGRLIFATVAGSGHGRMDIMTDGSVRSTSRTAYLSLDTIHFYSEQ